MPYVHVSPDVFLTHEGVTVWHIYEAGDDWPIRFWFTTDEGTADDFFGHGNRGQFDARRLVAKWSDAPNVAEWEEFWKPRYRTEDECLEALIRTAIEEGRIPKLEPVRYEPRTA